jgi:guanylate kinase
MYKTIVFVGPSAIGKTFIADYLVENYPNYFDQAKIYTTREPRLGENQTDRIFVNENDFEKLYKKGSFIYSDNFGENMYGFTNESLYPNNKHLLLNAWPWLVKDLQKLPHIVIVGMQTPANWRKLLMNRMKNRGDNEMVVQKRLVLIEKDSHDLKQFKNLINTNGKYFVIKSDETVYNTVIPWILKHIKLQP